MPKFKDRLYMLFFYILFLSLKVKATPPSTPLCLWHPRWLNTSLALYQSTVYPLSRTRTASVYPLSRSPIQIWLRGTGIVSYGNDEPSDLICLKSCRDVVDIPSQPGAWARRHNQSCRGCRGPRPLDASLHSLLSLYRQSDYKRSKQRHKSNTSMFNYYKVDEIKTSGSASLYFQVDLTFITRV